MRPRRVKSLASPSKNRAKVGARGAPPLSQLRESSLISGSLDLHRTGKEYGLQPSTEGKRDAELWPRG